jgi:hypothetical protein
VNRAGINVSADDFGASVLGDTNNDGLKEIVDGWKMPIMLFRWPYGNLELTNSNPAVPGSTQSFFADPLDTQGLLITPNPYTTYPTPTPGAWWNSVDSSGILSRSKFELLFHSISAPNPPVPPLFTPNPPFAVEYYMIPVVASAGPNKSWGLYPAYDTTAISPYPKPLWPNGMISDGSGDDNDNIYSYRLKLGAPGN